MNIYRHIIKKYNLKTDVIEIPNVGRDDLAELAHELDLKVGAEIGVAAGKYSEVLMQANPQMKLYGVDPHEPYQGYKDYVKTETFQQLVDDAHARLDKYPNYQFVRKYSLDAAKDFAAGSLDFVYIDANHSEPYVSLDIETWSQKVRSGGIVSGDDYARIKGKDGQDSKNWAVIQAVKRYTKERDIPLFIWGLEARIPGLKRDGGRSWMFINP